MIRHALIALLIAGLVLFGAAGIAHAQLPFGGFNIISIPCFVGDSPPYGYLTYEIPVSVSPPNLMFITPPLTIWYSYDDPIVPTVPLLGLYDPVPIECVVGIVSIGYGFDVLGVGSGLP